MPPRTVYSSLRHASERPPRAGGHLVPGFAAGAFLGLAVGDALGTTLEFSPRDSLAHHTEMTGGGPFDLAPGVWTDDTAMALALADSIVSCRGLDPTDVMDRFRRWWREGAYSPTGACFDIGATTREALARFEATGNPFAGSVDPRAAGNGGIMRVAPAVLAGPGTAQAFAVVQSLTTHAAAEAVDAARLLADILSRLVRREPGDAPPTIDGLLLPDFRSVPTIEAIARGDWRAKTRDEIRSSGYVVHTLEAALWAVGRTRSFEEALVLAVNLGDDADTVGAVAGQIAGALYGLASIPMRWLSLLAWRDELIGMAGRLVTLDAAQPADNATRLADDPKRDPVRLRGLAADLDPSGFRPAGIEP